jgi:hypothetical protein
MARPPQECVSTEWASARSPSGRSPPGTGVTVGCGADGPSVVTFPEGPKVVCPVTVGARVELASTDSAQNATRQVTAQNSRREDPDMVSSALASR